VQFGFARPLPAWGWLLVVAAAVLVAAWSYWRLPGRLWSRVALAGARALVLALLAVLIAGPQLVKPNERIEKDWVLVLLDRSGSMAIADAPVAAEGQNGHATRDEQLKAAIEGAWPAFAQLAKDRTVVFLGFDSGVYDLKVREKGGAPAGVEVGPAAGRRTSLGAALEQALARAAARPLSGVVVVSDGRSVDEPGRNTLRRLQAEKIPVYTVPLGSPDPVTDLAVAKAEAPALAFTNDTVPVSVEVDRIGAATATPGKVQLIDKATGLVLDERALPADAAAWANGRTQVTLTNRPDAAGKFAWVVRLVPGGPDLIQQNNQAELAIETVDRPLRVAYFDGYPRWEYRYVKNLLVRENSIQSVSMLLAANRQYLQEGNITLDALPRSPEEWAKFDVVVLGDLPGAMFTREQLEQLREHVAVRGAGLLWIGGPAATPATWRDTPLADLLPFTLAANGGTDASVRAWDEPVVMFPAPAAKRLNILELGETPEEGWPAKLSDPATGWSVLRYAQRVDPDAVKPTAEVLAYVAGVSQVPSGGGPEALAAGLKGTPAVLSMRYGAGRVIYVATDEIWRWRYARGEALEERFWLPILRLQGRESLARAARPATLEVLPRRPEVEQPVRVAVQILDQSLLDTAPPSLTVRLKRDGDPSGGATLTLAPEGQGSTRAAMRSFAATWLPSEPGKYRIEVADALLAGSGLVAEAEVTLPDDELRHPETDHPLLARLSQATEGRVMTAADLKTIADPTVLPKREVHITGTPDVEPLWDKGAVLALLAMVLAAEWVGRRLIRLA
jgi:hypothetical protein